jgi:hypothetical protein
MEYKLANTKSIEVSEIKKQLALGAKFVVFRYQISFIAISFERYSPVYLIQNKAELKKLQHKYNQKTMLLGPWSFPWGPFESYSAIKVNNAGGLDVTKDIILNLDFYDKESNTIVLKEMHTVFGSLSKSDFKEVKKAFSAYLSKTKRIEAIYIATYINVDEYTEPPFMIGLNTTLDKSIVAEQLKELFYQRFYPMTELVLFLKSEDEELFLKIKEQGQQITNSI